MLNSFAGRIPRCARGFTLIEVVFALVILGASLVVLLGLQSSLITRTLRDESQEQALLLTRRLLAPLEAGLSSTNTVEITGTFQEVYSKIMPPGVSAQNSKSIEGAADPNDSFNITYSIADWKIANIDADVMRKVSVIVSWGKATADRTTTNYFIPVVPQ